MTLLESNLHWGRPAEPNGTAALVLAGSSGRIDTARVDMLATHGVTALGMRWFGGDGQPAVPLEVPLEPFVEALDLLARDADRLVLMGQSYGAEAALLTATTSAATSPRLDAVIAFQPTDVAWEGQASNDDDPYRSKWTLGGKPVPFVPLDRSWQPPGSGKPAFVDYYEHSRTVAGPDAVAAATIPVENITADVLLVASGDDKVWASLPQAKRIVQRRAAAGHQTVLVSDEHAGHPVVLPDEAAPTLDRPYQVGGDADAPQRLGRTAWPHITQMLNINA